VTGSVWLKKAIAFDKDRVKAEAIAFFLETKLG
jgi:hypothetical protein